MFEGFRMFENSLTFLLILNLLLFGGIAGLVNHGDISENFQIQTWNYFLPRMLKHIYVKINVHKIKKCMTFKGLFYRKGHKFPFLLMSKAD